jgi:dipeptidyl-peptidase-4
LAACSFGRDPKVAEKNADEGLDHKASQHPPTLPANRSIQDREGASGAADDGDAATMKTRAKITIEDITSHKAIGGPGPSRLAFTPDGQSLTYLGAVDGGLTKQLYALDLKTGESTVIATAPGKGATEENLSIEEKLRRERSRAHSLGIPGYFTAEHGTGLLFTIAGELWFKKNPEAALERLLDRSSGPALDARLSDDGKLATFVRDNEVFVIETEVGSKPRQISDGPKIEGISRGVAEYVAQEEMVRYSGYWLAPNSQNIAYTQVDERHIEPYRIMHQGQDEIGAAAREDHRYPFAGHPNAKVELWLTKVGGGSAQRVDLPVEGWNDDYYLARVDWSPANELYVQVQNREQTELRLARIDLRTGHAKVLIREESLSWVNLHDSLHFLRANEHVPDGAFLWKSEKSGYAHLYLHDANGTQLAQLTAGEWVVDELDAVDDARGKVYFHGNKGDPTQTHCFEVGIDGKGERQLTSEVGSHHCVYDPTFTHYVDSWSSLTQAPRTVIRTLADNKIVHDLHNGSDDSRIAKLELVSPQIQTIKSRDGETLYVSVLRPDPAIFGPGPYPTLVSVYGGPHSQRVSQNWGMTTNLREQFLRQNGYLTLRVDNRGSPRRGLAFESKIRHDLGNVEVQDQVDGVRWAVQEQLADPARVGISGWSYGGYMSAMSLARAPETFKIGIAGAPVTHWDGYDTHYTERYMGLPDKNVEGYKNSSVMAHVEKQRGKLFIIHGLIDENVHFRHSARLINALIEAKKPYELLLFPEARHGPRRDADRTHLEERFFDFVSREL